MGAMTTDAEAPAPSLSAASDERFKANFAANLARLREAAGMNRAQFARRIGVDKMRITRLESGEHAPGGALLLRIAQALGVTAEALAADPLDEAAAHPPTERARGKRPRRG